MKIFFKKIRFRNFLSYGNNYTEIDLTTPGMSWITGRNGAGKSVIINALSFVLFGKPLRQVKLAELVNRINKKNTEVEIWFDVNEVEYYIKRTIKPETLVIKKNNVDLELRSSKKLIQDDIEKIIGVSFTIFKNAISLSLSNNVPFLIMTAAEKRKIIEEMFGIAVFAHISKSVKADMTNIKLEMQALSANINAQKSLIETLSIQLKSYKESVSNFEKNKKEQLELLQSQFDTAKANMDFIADQAKTLIKEYNDTQILQIDNSIIATNNITIGELTSEVKALKQKYEFYSKNDICPSCNQPIEIDKCGVDLKSIKDEAKIKIEKIEKLKLQNSEVQSAFNKMNEELKALEALKTKISTLNTQYVNAKNLVSNISSKLSSVLDSKFEIDVSEMENKLQSSQSEFDGYNLKYNECSSEMSDLQLLAKIASDDGIKKFFLEQVAPILSAKSNYYIDKFDLPVTIIFDSQFNCILADAVSGIEISYEAFSEGEKKRIDIAILLSIIETMKSVKNWDCNIIFFDELFDNAVDAENLNAMFNALSDIIKSNEEMGIYLISHRIVDHLKYSRKITLAKSEGFSSMSIEDGNLKEEFYG